MLLKSPTLPLEPGEQGLLVQKHLQPWGCLSCAACTDWPTSNTFACSTDVREANGSNKVWRDLICWLDLHVSRKIQTCSGINKTDRKLNCIVKMSLVRPFLIQMLQNSDWCAELHVASLIRTRPRPAARTKLIPGNLRKRRKKWLGGGGSGSKPAEGGWLGCGLGSCRTSSWTRPDCTSQPVRVRRTKSAIIRALPPRIDGSPESSSSLTGPSTLAGTRSVCQVSGTWSPLASYVTFFFSPMPRLPHPDRVATRCETRSRNVFSANMMYV